MSTFLMIGLLMILGTFCLILLMAAFFGFRGQSNQNVLTHMAKLQGGTINQDQS